MSSAKSAFSSLSPVAINVEGFDGPLELLLHHVVQGQLDITTVAVASVADQYFATVRLLPPDAKKLDFLAEFLVVGAHLLLLKSRALLPREAASAIEELVDDPESLEARLREYRRFRQAATHLGERQQRGERSFPRLAPPPLPPPAAPRRLERAAPEQLAAALQRLLTTRLPARTPEPPPRVTIAERIVEINAAVGEHGRVSFLWLARDCASRSELIVTFLAILELYRGRAIELEQEGTFGEIWVTAYESTENSNGTSNS